VAAHRLSRTAAAIGVRVSAINTVAGGTDDWRADILRKIMFRYANMTGGVYAEHENGWNTADSVLEMIRQCATQSVS